MTFQGSKINKGKGAKMKRLFLSGVLGVFILGSVFAATSVKYTFSDVDYLDASGNVVATGTIQATVKTTRSGQVITCGYFTDPNDQYAGQYQATDGTVNGDSATAVRTYCEQNFQNRQVLPK
jgi:hypothetical protein